MAITATEATVWHTAPANSLNYRMSRSSTGEIQIRKISVFAIAAAVVATGVASENSRLAVADESEHARARLILMPRGK